MFNAGRNVVLIAISPDSPEELHSWADDEDFPFLFGSDPDGSAYQALGGALREGGGGMPSERTVFVIGPDGRVELVVPDFNEVDPTAYEEVASVVDRVTPEPADGNR